MTSSSDHRTKENMSRALRDVIAERKRQITVEGWCAEHDDDEHANGQLAEAAACYAAPKRVWPGSFLGTKIQWWQRRGGYLLWPWHPSWWKPTTPRRNLVKAGALILAEIERLDRASERANEQW